MHKALRDRQKNTYENFSRFPGVHNLVGNIGKYKRKSNTQPNLINATYAIINTISMLGSRKTGKERVTKIHILSSFIIESGSFYKIFFPQPFLNFYNISWHGVIKEKMFQRRERERNKHANTMIGL